MNGERSDKLNCFQLNSQITFSFAHGNTCIWLLGVFAHTTNANARVVCILHTLRTGTCCGATQYWVRLDAANKWYSSCMNPSRPTARAWFIYVIGNARRPKTISPCAFHHQPTRRANARVSSAAHESAWCALHTTSRSNIHRSTTGVLKTRYYFHGPRVRAQRPPVWRVPRGAQLLWSAYYWRPCTKAVARRALGFLVFSLAQKRTQTRT